MKIRIGTRKSRLALVQTNMVIDELKSVFPDINIEVVTISTKGDRVIDKPLYNIGGKGVFVSEIEKMLESGDIDIAVHSGKDLPYRISGNLEIPGVLSRGDYRDALVTLKGKMPEKNSTFTVGTGSIRRAEFIKKLYPSVQVIPVRGNVDTRLKKLKCGEFDGLILASAGIQRLETDCSEFDMKLFDYNEFLPAPCQGIIAVQTRKNSPESEIVQKISHKDTMLCFETERKVMEILGADCSVPLGVYSYIVNGYISLSVSLDGSRNICGKAMISDRIRLAEELVKGL